MPALNLAALSTRDKLVAITFVVAVGTLIAGWSFVVKPELNAAAKIRAEKNDYRERVGLVSKIADAEKRLAALHGRLPEKAEISWLIETINKLADDAGISLLSVTPVSREPFEGYYRLPVRIDIECSYHQLGDFVSRVENSPRFLSVRAMRVEGQRVPDASGAAKLRVNLLLSALYPGAEAK